MILEYKPETAPEIPDLIPLITLPPILLNVPDIPLKTFVIPDLMLEQADVIPDFAEDNLLFMVEPI